MRKKTIVYDFDLTLVDSQSEASEGIIWALEKMGMQSPSMDVIEKTFGMDAKDAFLFMKGEEFPERAEEFYKTLSSRPDEMVLPNLTLYPGVVETLEALYAQKIDLAINSNRPSDRIKSYLKKNSLGDLFSEVIGPNDVEPAKPSAAGLVHIMNQLGRTRDQILMVGDSEFDAQSAVNGAVDFVGILGGNASADSLSVYNPVALLESAADLDMKKLEGLFE